MAIRPREVSRSVYGINRHTDEERLVDVVVVGVVVVIVVGDGIVIGKT